MTEQEARNEGLHETVLLPEGWSVEFRRGWGDPESGPSADEDLGMWLLKLDGILVVDASVGTPDDGLYEWLTGGDTYDPPHQRTTYPQDDVIQILNYLQQTGAVI